MAIRLQGELNTIFNSAYKIEIDDTEYTGSTIDFTCAGEGFTLEYQGQNSKRFNPILSSYITIYMVIENSDHDTFLDDLNTAKEGQYKIKVTRSGVIVWVGEVLMDTVEEVDTSPRRVFSISGIDGLGKLRQIKYNNSGNAYTGSATILDHLFNILNKTNLPFFYTTENFLKIVCNWYDDAHVYVNTLDPLSVTRVNHKVFYTTDKLGNKKFQSCFQVLKNICQLFGARIYQAGGSIRLEQINERKDTQFTEHIYDKAGTKLSTNTSASNEITLNQSSFARLHGGVFSKFPPLKNVSIFYKHEKVENLLEGQIWDNTNHVNFNVGDFKNEPTNFIFTGKLYFKTTSTLNEGESVNFRGAFRIKFKWGTYWYSRDAINNNGTVDFGNHFWSSSEDYYEISSQFIHIFIDYDPGANNTFEESRIINISFETPALSLTQQSGSNQLDFDVELINLLDIDNAAVNSNITTLDEWSITDAKLTLKEGSVSTEGGRIYSVSSPNEAVNSETIDFETVFADGPTANSPGRLEVYNGSTWENSSAWKIDDDGTAYKIQELVIREILAGQINPVNRYNGTIRGKIDAFSRLSFDSSKWLLLGGTFMANSEQWSGEWFHIAVDETGITTDPEEPVPTNDPPIGPATDGGGLGTVGNPPGFVPAGQTVGTVTGGIVNGSNINGIIINPIGENNVILSGDNIQLVDVISGNTQTFTVADDVGANDNQINVNSTTATTSFAPNSSIIIPSTSQSSGNNSVAQLFNKNDLILPYKIVAGDIVIDTDINAGNGSTAGLKIDSAGLSAYNDSSSTAVTKIDESDGKLKVNLIAFNEQSTDPSTVGELEYVNGELKYHDGAEVKTLVTGSSASSAAYLTFHTIARGTSWTTGYLNDFFVPGSEIGGKSIKKIIFGMTTGPDGTGTTTIITRKNGASVSTLSIVTPVPTLLNQTLSPSNFTLAANDKIEFEITALASTPPQGLTIILKIE